MPRYWRHLRGNDFTTPFGNLPVFRKNVDINTFNMICDLVDKTWKPNVGQGADAKNLSHNTMQITRIERIENRDLFVKYTNKRKEFFAKLADSRRFKPLEDTQLRSGHPDAVSTMANIDGVMLSDIFHEINESYLFHGTRPEAEDNIVRKGLNPLFGSDNAMFGRGIYSAESPTKADQYTGNIGFIQLCGYVDWLVGCIVDLRR